jgi:carbohydrate diacid regulator
MRGKVTIQEDIFMKITHNLAQQIVDRTISIIGKNINIMDENGFIIGTGDRSRLNQYHEGAALVIKNKEKMFIYPENENHLVGVKPGVNLPIEDNNEIIGVVGITGNPGEVGPFGEIIKMAVEMMLQQQFWLKEIDLERQAKENFIHDLISGRVGNDKDLFIARGNIVGYDITIPRVALSINIYRFEKTARNSIRDHSGLKEGEIYLQRLKNDILRTIRDLFQHQPQDIVSYVGGDRFVVLKTINISNKPEIIRAKLIKISNQIKEAILIQRKFVASIGMGEYHPGIKGIMHSYQEACRAIEIGDKVNSKIGIHHIADLGIYRLCAEVNPEIRNNYIKNIFEKDINKRKGLKAIFWDTLQVFFENNLNITNTSKAIFVHRNTLLYRLEKIRNATGLDPRKFNEAIQLYIALKMKHFQEE